MKYFNKVGFLTMITPKDQLKYSVWCSICGSNTCKLGFGHILNKITVKMKLTCANQQEGHKGKKNPVYTCCSSVLMKLIIDTCSKRQNDQNLDFPKMWLGLAGELQDPSELIEKHFDMSCMVHIDMVLWGKQLNYHCYKYSQTDC